jgi:rhodanese-related sulfurtransferase
MKTMTVKELRRRLDAGPVALFDVRGDVDYQRGHVPGAMSAPLGSLTFRVAGTMNPDSLVVVYAADDELGTEAAARLADLRMSNVHVLAGGLNEWRRAGQEVVAVAVPKPGTDGPVEDVRPIVVDRERAYGGAFRGEPTDVDGAGG